MRKILYSIVVMLSALSLASCDDDPDYPALDPDLQGMWQLTYINGYPVGGFDTNWLQFYNDGSGTYYYYDNGRLMQMGLVYGVNYDWTQLYVDYADGWSLDSNYWFNSNATRLYLSWYDDYGQQTYTYDYVTGPTPWYAPAAKALDTPAASTFTTTRPANRPATL